MNRFTLVRLPTLAQAGKRVRGDAAAREFRAGGIDLLDRMKEGLDEPDELVELHAISGDEGRRMRGIERREKGAFRIGALVTMAQVADYEELPSGHAALGQAAGSAATPAIRNAATVGGNLLQRPRCWYFRHADLECLKKGGFECLALTGDNRYNAILGGGPSFIVHPSSLATALLALEAEVTVHADGSARTIPIANLFALPTVDPVRESTLAPGEVVLSIDLPPPGPGQRSAYLAAKEKQSHDWPLCEAAVRCSIADGKLTGVRVVLGHVAPVPWHATAAEKMLEGQAPSADVFERAATAALADAKPLSNNGYKIPLAQGLLRQALHQATGVPLPE
jgi:xanthine dehydrogenase YagS FAD-binding subunit